MKTSILLPFLSACCLSVSGQSFVSSTIRAHRAVPIGPHETRVEVQRDALDENGEPTQVTTSYIRLATGLNRWDDTQKSWVAAVPEFEKTEDGYFVARKTRTQLILPPDISAEPVDMLGPDGVRLISAPIGVAVVDLSTGDTALLGSLTSCRAEQVAPDTVVFRNCLAGGIRGDLVFRISLSGMEQFLVLREWIPSLADLGMEPAHVRVQLYTEFFDAPEPTGDAVILKRADETTLAQRVWEPNLTDRRLQFGESTLMIPGRAFSAGEQNVDAPVGKSYEAVEDRRVLVESCDYIDVAPWLKQLPVPKEDVRYEGVRLEPGKLVPSNLPEREVAKPRWASLPFESRLKERAWASVSPETLKAADTGSYLADSGRGFVLDYTISGALSNYTLKGNTTYYVSDDVTLTGTTTLEGGAVIKAEPSTQLLVLGAFECKTALYRPAVFTARDDDTVGEVLAESTHVISTSTYGLYPLYLDTGGAVDVHHVQIKHGYHGVLFEGEFSHQLRHAQIVDCKRAVAAADDLSLDVHNVLIAGVKPGGAAFWYDGSATVNGQHVTVTSAPNLHQNATATSLTLANSLLVDVSSIQDYTRRGEDDNVETTGVSTVFQSVGAGHHYLPSGSPYRNAGTDQIDAALLADLRTLTTSAPPEYENVTLSSATEWDVQVDRDWGAPELGYHYPPIDYAVNHVTVEGQNGSLSVKPGVIIGVFGYLGIVAEDYAQVSLVGSALDRITLAHYSAIQEQSASWGTAPYSPTMIYGPPHNVIAGHDSPDVELRFMDTSVMGGRGNGVYFLNNWAAVKTLVARDCRFFGGYTWFGSHASQEAVIEVCNNLFRRSENKFYGWMNLTAYNNLFFGGNSNQFSCYIAQPGTWTVKDNVFQDTCIGGSASYIARGHNAYLGTVSPVPPGWGAAGDVTFSSFAYTSGPLGEFYQADTGLKDEGSRPAADAGLYHHTAEASGVKEGLGTEQDVDIGFHYVAINGSTGRATDTDEDGLADYLEDQNGNGSVESGETSFESADTDGDGFEDWLELLGPELPSGDPLGDLLDPFNADTNANGIPDGQEQGVPPLSVATDFVATPPGAGSDYAIQVFEVPAETDAVWFEATVSSGWEPEDAMQSIWWRVHASWGFSAGQHHTMAELYPYPAGQNAWTVGVLNCLDICHLPEATQRRFVVIEAGATKDGPEHSRSFLEIGGSLISVRLTSPSNDGKFVFDEEQPGNLPIFCQAWLDAPVGIRSRLVNEMGFAVFFAVDPIGNSVPEWNNPGPDPYVGPAVNTLGDYFENMVWFSGLPAKYSDFGPKKVRLFTSHWDDSVAKIKVFYPARGFNHPGGTPPGAAPSSRRPANYWYYYMDSEAAVSQTDYGPFYNGTPYSQGASQTPPPPPWYYYVADSDHEPTSWDPITFPPPTTKAIPLPGVNGGDTLNYIDRFAWAARHERAHHQNYSKLDWWPDIYDDARDHDHDYLPDELEATLETGDPSTHFDPTKMDTFSNDDMDNDAERHNPNSQFAEEWTLERQAESVQWDWAKPGKNWPQSSQ